MFNNSICGDIPDWLANNRAIRTLTLDMNQWSCPIPNYCDDEKIKCDYKDGMECTELTLIDPDICRFDIPIPSFGPSVATTFEPSEVPSEGPTEIPTGKPTDIPTGK